MSKLVISKPNFSKTDVSYLLKHTLTCTFQEVRNFTGLRLLKFIGVA